MSTTSDAVTCVAMALLLGIGAVIDVRTRRIPNVLTLATAALGVTLAAFGATHVTLVQSVAGLLVGALLMLPGYLLGATGAGDVKASGGAGAVLGIARVPAAFFYTAIAGGVIALCVIAVRRRRSAIAHDRFFPYGPAIAVGSLLAAIGI